MSRKVHPHDVICERVRDQLEQGADGVTATVRVQKVRHGNVRASLLLPALMAGGLACGCQLLGKDQGRCDQSASTVRQAISLKDFESARSWRDYTWKVCDERAIVATLDKEITDGEAALAAELKAKAENAQKLAQTNINQAQALWRKFDAAEAKDRNREALDATRKSAKRLEDGLTPAYSAKVRAYNDGEYQKRLATLGR